MSHYQTAVKAKTFTVPQHVYRGILVVSDQVAVIYVKCTDTIAPLDTRPPALTSNESLKRCRRMSHWKPACTQVDELADDTATHTAVYTMTRPSCAGSILPISVQMSVQPFN